MHGPDPRRGPVRHLLIRPRCRLDLRGSNGSFRYVYVHNTAEEFSLCAMMLNLKGCQIFAYDHTINAPPRRGQNIQYFKTGVGFGENLKPLSQIIAENDHKNTGIDYLKVKYKEYIK